MSKLYEPEPDVTRLDNTRFAVLGLLSLQPMSGYEVRKHVRASLETVKRHGGRGQTPG